MTNDQMEERSSKILKDLESEMRTVLEKSVLSEFKYYVDAKKTRHRALSSVFSYGIFKDDIEKVIPAAAALELIIVSSTIMDDLIERESIRSGLRPLHRKMGEWYASLAALEGILLSLNHISTNYNDTLAVEVHKSFTDNTLKAIRGEIITKVETATDAKVTVEQYLRGLEVLNGAPYGFSTELGAIIAEASEEDRVRVYQHGFHKGVASQVLDEIKNVYGKNTHNRLSEAKRGRNLLWIYAKEFASKKQIKQLKKSLINNQYEEFTSLVEDIGAVEFSRDLCIEEVRKSVQQLHPLRQNEFSKYLIKTALDIKKEAEEYEN